MDVITIYLKVFVDSIKKILSAEIENNQVYCIETRNRENGVIMNFNANDFKKFITKESKVNKLNESFISIIKIYKKLGFIVTEKNRLTHVKRYRGKSIRVISVKKDVFLTLKSLM